MKIEEADFRNLFKSRHFHVVESQPHLLYLLPLLPQGMNDSLTPVSSSA